MKWYLTPKQIEFPNWSRAAIALQLPNVSIPAREPVGQVVLGDAALMPLIDNPPVLADDQIIGDRQITVSGGTATAVYSVASKPDADRLQERQILAKGECRRRILTVVDETAQANLTANDSAGVLTAEQKAVYQAGVIWINQMRATWRPLAADFTKDISADENWPAPSADIVSLAQAF